MATNDFVISASLLQVDTNTKLRPPQKILAQTGQNSASGEPISTTSLAAFDLTDVLIAGQGWLINLGTNDVTCGIFVTTVDPVSAFYPVFIAKPGIAMPIYFDTAIKTTTPLQHKTASGTSVISWRIWQV